MVMALQPSLGCVPSFCGTQSVGHRLAARMHVSECSVASIYVETVEMA